MKKIVPLKGFLIATAATALQSIETEESELQGFKFLVVDSQSKRAQVQDTKTRVRLFKIREVYEDAEQNVKDYVGKKMYCICLEKEELNNIIIDKDSGERLFIIPEQDILAELRETND